MNDDMEHRQVYMYVAGCYDIATVKLEGYVVISEAELARLKAGIPAPAAPVLSEKQAHKLRSLASTYGSAMRNRWQERDPQNDAVAQLKKAHEKLQTFIRSLT